MCSRTCFQVKLFISDVFQANLREMMRQAAAQQTEAALPTIISVRQNNGQAKEDLRQQSASSLEVEEWVTKAVDLEVVKERLPGFCIFFRLFRLFVMFCLCLSWSFYWTFWAQNVQQDAINHTLDHSKMIQNVLLSWLSISNFQYERTELCFTELKKLLFHLVSIHVQLDMFDQMFFL